MATTQKRKSVPKTRKRTVTIEDEVMSLAAAPMTKTVKSKKTPKKTPARKPVVAKKTPAKKVATKKPAAKKTAAKTVTSKKPVAKKKPATKAAAKKPASRSVRTRKPQSIREAIAEELRVVETEVKTVAHNPTVHRVVRFSELYVLSVLITVLVLSGIAWVQTILRLFL